MPKQKASSTKFDAAHDQRSNERKKVGLLASYSKRIEDGDIDVGLNYVKDSVRREGKEIYLNLATASFGEPLLLCLGKLAVDHTSTPVIR